MTPNAERILAEALQLSEAERTWLVHSLILSLDNEVDEDHEALWEAELMRRLAEIESGESIGIPAEDVFAGIRAKYGHGDRNI